MTIMSAYDALPTAAANHDADQINRDATAAAVELVLGKDRITLRDFLVLLSDAAVPMLEPMAQKAATATRRHFGNVVFMFTPMYISNFCTNRCPYCSFARQHDVSRRRLTIAEIEREAREISSTGMRHILVLTGEDPATSTHDYLRKSVRTISRYFSSVGLELYPLKEEQYGALAAEGADYLTIYQETYDEELYRRLHAGGPKADFLFRLDAPDRACRRGMRGVTIGALLGLRNFRREALCMALHAAYLQRTYPEAEICLSFPRLCPQVGDFTISHPVSEKRLVQIIAAFRLLFPHMGITLSTRESQRFRNGVLPAGITRMSAGVSTAVGGHIDSPTTSQFKIADMRSVAEVREALLARGFQPVMHDWNRQMNTAG